MLVEAYLDYGHHVSCRVWELGHVYCEMSQLIPLRLLQHQLRSFPDCIDATQVRGGVGLRVWCSRQWYIGYAGHLRNITVDALRAESAGGGVKDGAIGVVVVCVFPPFEEPHVCGWVGAL